MKIKMLLVLIVFLFSIVCVSASDVNDTLAGADEIQVLEANETSQDVLSSTDDGTFSSLQSKINNASSGSTITLDRDYSYDENLKSNGIIIDKDLTINGNGHKLDGKSKSRMFIILYGFMGNYRVTLNNIHFVNGYTPYDGGAILEIKVQHSIPLWLTKILTEGKIYQTSFSKVGTAHIKELKKQHFNKVVYEQQYVQGGRQYGFTI